MSLLQLTMRADSARRLREIVRILAKYSLAGWLKHVSYQPIRDALAKPDVQALSDAGMPERIRGALAELGPTFIKFGQVLSTRQDLVGIEIAAELGKLQSGTPADPWADVVATVQGDLGAPPEQLFESFEKDAFSSASIGQVHRAQLPGGEQVVVKVQHAGIQDKVRLDLEMLVALAELLQEYVEEARPYQPVSTTQEFRRTLLRELDFSSERRHMEEFTKNFVDDPTVHIPVVSGDRCGRRVLTMELLQGIPGSQPDKMRESGIDLNEFARRAANCFLNMIFRDGFYHADPHPGNFLVLPGGVLGLLDCGMVGRIDESLRELFEELLLRLLDKDAEGLSDLLLRAGSAPPDVDRAGFRTDVSDFILEYGSQSLNDFDLGGALEQLTSIMRRHRVLLPSSASLLLKTLVMLEGTSKLFNPSLNLIELVEPFKNQLIAERMDPSRWLRKLRRSGRDLDRLIVQAPRNVADILDRLQSGNFQIRHEHENLEATANRIVAGILAASVFLGSSILLSQGLSPRLFGISILGGLGCLASLGLAARLLWTVRRDLK